MCAAGTLCTLTLAFASMAPTAGPSMAEVRPAPSAPGGYAMQMVLTDAAMFGVSAVLTGVGQPTAGAVVASAGYVFDGAVVHGLHGESLRALGSLGLRLGTPFAAGLLGAAVSPCGKPSNDMGSCPGKYGGGVVGMLAGAGIALVIDDLFLARD